MMLPSSFSYFQIEKITLFRRFSLPTSKGYLLAEPGKSY